MEYTYELMRKCHGLRFRATVLNEQVEGVIKADDSPIVLCYGKETLGNPDYFNRSKRVYLGDAQRFELLFGDLEIVPRDPETYKDWQVGDHVAMPDSDNDNDNNNVIIIFRAGELVAFKRPTGDGRWEGYSPYTCEELFEKGWRLVLTDIEKQIIEERKKAEDIPEKNPEAVQDLINKALDGYTPKGNLEGFPLEVIAKMLERQYEQTGKVQIEVFEEDRLSFRRIGGFDWNHTPEGDDIWVDVLLFGDFSEFFRRYPREEKCPFKKFDAVLVRDGDGDKWIPSMFDRVDSSKEYPFRTINGIGHKHCAPLNEETSRYVWTAEQIPGAL